MNNTKIQVRKKVNFWGLIAGLILFFILTLFPVFQESELASKMLAIAVLMTTWWITEAIPLAVTALLPLILMPLLSLIPTEKVASEYFNSTIFLFLGGFFIAIAIEKWNIHKRLALQTIKLIGKNPNKIVLGFMIASALISMFISNTATAIMMLPIGLSVVLNFENDNSFSNISEFTKALFLAIAYSCSIGGIATLIGTAPNLVFQRIFSINFPDAPAITFGQWMIFGFPLAIIMLFTVWLILTKIIFNSNKNFIINRDNISEQHKNLGKISFEEKIMLIILTITALLWIFRRKIVLGEFIIPGWSDNLPFSEFIDDATIAIFMAIILFIIPAKSKQSKILSIQDFKKIPWDIVILFGGGFALAKGFQETGLSLIIGKQLELIANLPLILMILFTCLLLTTLTELTSNTAITQTVLPIIASLSIALNLHPLILMIPATISASFAFMLPVATPPNAIVFATGKITIQEMAKTGFIINIVGAIITTLFFYFIGYKIFNINLITLPH